MSTAINVFLKKVARKKRIPLELSADPFCSESNISHLEKIAAQVNAETAILTEHEIIEFE